MRCALPAVRHVSSAVARPMAINGWVALLAVSARRFSSCSAVRFAAVDPACDLDWQALQMAEAMPGDFRSVMYAVRCWTRACEGLGLETCSIEALGPANAWSHKDLVHKASEREFLNALWCSASDKAVCRGMCSQCGM